VANGADPIDLISRFRGCLLGGAVGDALGAPIEFDSLAQIRARFGDRGVTEFVDGTWPRGTITDDTQMTLFTAEGLLRADVRGSLKGICHPPDCVGNAYCRWLHTQGEPFARTVVGHQWSEAELDGWLISVPGLFAARAPGNTCVQALRGERYGTIEEPLNDSKGCGGVMRAAPAGLMAEPWGDGGDSFRRGADIAALTHGHPTGYLAAGCLALAVERLRRGDPLEVALDRVMKRLREEPHHDEVSMLLAAARELAVTRASNPERVEQFGGGWVAEEAFAIAAYAVAATDSFPDAVLLAVNHGGDSDSTGAIAGNLAGTLYGVDAIPADWLAQLELRDVIDRMATDLHRCSRGSSAWDPEEMWNAYPGW